MNLYKKLDFVKLIRQLSVILASAVVVLSLLIPLAIVLLSHFLNKDILLYYSLMVLVCCSISLFSGLLTLAILRVMVENRI